uniref:Ubiquitin-like protease family profile domain-containing protein n=1 Tax=viral metagenome TaxID=1070528 RepID=A0A6C0L4J5_9ZZZZ
MYDSKNCSPSKKRKTGSCLPNPLLKKIVKLLNEKYKCKLQSSGTQNNIYTSICDKIKQISECETEACWSTLDVIKNGLNQKEYRNFTNSFRPFMPESWKQNPNTWLNTNDIDNVLKQYEKKYNHFEYIGAIPIDFDKKTITGQCAVSDLCKIDIQNMSRNKKCIGIVFNTDAHNEPGKHWFSVYIDLKKAIPAIYYFDSLAEEPQQEIIDFVKKIEGELNGNCKVLYNDIQHQHGNTECGVYSLHFITSMLKGTPFKKYINTINTDKQMEEMRQLFFVDI